MLAGDSQAVVVAVAAAAGEPTAVASKDHTLALAFTFVHARARACAHACTYARLRSRSHHADPPPLRCRFAAGAARGHPAWTADRRKCSGRTLCSCLASDPSRRHAARPAQRLAYSMRATSQEHQNHVRCRSRRKWHAVHAFAHARTACGSTSCTCSAHLLRLGLKSEHLWFGLSACLQRLLRPLSCSGHGLSAMPETGVRRCFGENFARSAQNARCDLHMHGAARSAPRALAGAQCAQRARSARLAATLRRVDEWLLMAGEPSRAPFRTCSPRPPAPAEWPTALYRSNPSRPIRQGRPTFHCHCSGGERGLRYTQSTTKIFVVYNKKMQE